MKIAVIGADTRLGRRIAKDAFHRRYAVTAVVQDKEKLDSVFYTVIEDRDCAFDAAGFDAVIDARTDTLTVTRGDAVVTFVPPACLDPDGRRQGAYRVGAEKGAYIGEEDFALAAVDAVCGTQTGTVYVESDRAPAQKEEPSGRRRYVAVPDAGIAGKVFRLALDTGTEHVVHFTADNQLLLAAKGEPFESYPCSCMHCDDGVWFVVFLRGTQCVTMLLDEAQSLVTVIYADPLPKKLNLMRHRFVFGEIARTGAQPTLARHAFTDEMVGTKVTWHYSPYVNITHCYFTENYMRNSLRGMKPLPPDAAPEAVWDAEDRVKRWRFVFFAEVTAKAAFFAEHLHHHDSKEGHEHDGRLPVPQPYGSASEINKRSSQHGIAVYFVRAFDHQMLRTRGHFVTESIHRVPLAAIAHIDNGINTEHEAAKHQHRSANAPSDTDRQKRRHAGREPHDCRNQADKENAAQKVTKEVSYMFHNFSPFYTFSQIAC